EMSNSSRIKTPPHLNFTPTPLSGWCDLLRIDHVLCLLALTYPYKFPRRSRNYCKRTLVRPQDTVPLLLSPVLVVLCPTSAGSLLFFGESRLGYLALGKHPFLLEAPADSAS